MGITSGSLSKLVFFSYLFSLKEKITNIRECEWKGDKFQGLVNDFKLVTWKKNKKIPVDQILKWSLLLYSDLYVITKS